MSLDVTLDTTPLFREYFRLQQKYEKLYGNNTVVMMEVGSFFEIYQVEYTSNRTSINIGKSKEVAEILNIQVTKKKKSAPSTAKNPYMIGFPNYAVIKFINRLVNNNFTVVKYDQKDIPNSTEKDRVLDKIYSPGTYIEYETPTSNFIVGVMFDNENAFCSAIDLSTGYVKLFSTHNTIEDQSRIYNEVFRFIHTIKPIEVLFAGERNIKLVEEFKLKESLTHFREIPPDYRKLSYQNSLLKKVYGKTSPLSPIEYINLERYPDLLLIFILLLQFAYEHEHSIIKRLSIPVIITTKDTLILNKDSIYQLNIVGEDKSKFSSVFNLVNFTNTSMGRRLLKERLLVPVTDIKKLEKRYDLLEEGVNCYEEYGGILSQIMDIEKKHRKGILKKLSPYEFYNLDISYRKICELLEKDLIVGKIVSNKTSKFFRKFRDEYLKIFNITVMENIFSLNDLRCSVFNKDQFPEIDEIQDKIHCIEQYFNSVREKYSKIVDPNNPIVIEILRNEKDGYYLKTTPTRFNKIKDDPEIIGTPIKNIAKFTTKTFEEKSNECLALEEDIIKLVKEKYITSIYNLFIGYRNTLNNIVKFVAELDVVCSSAKASVKYAYHRPKLVKNDGSTVKFKGIRHPLIERIIDSEYVTNDLNLNGDGILLYGLNSVGKSSLLRSIGCNVVLAQAGMFVACEEMELTPFSLLFSKISSVDNLFQGQSTFISEMTELRSILRGADKTSLILADELCSGTESLSATSIVATTLLELLSRETCFLFSTHLHSLAELEEIKNNEKLSIYHFAIAINDNGEVDYIRKLQKGQGDTLYGLEIARTLTFSPEFMRKAFEIRAEMEGKENKILSTKKSRYNSDVYVHSCEKCGKERGESGGFLETHHINFQCTADKNGVINGKFHKNEKHNLVVLCRDCHTTLHSEHSRHSQYS